MAHQGSKPGQKCQTSSKRKMGQRNEESASETPREDIHTPSSQAQGEPSEPRSAQAPDTKRARTHERRDYSERATAPPPDPVLRSQGSFPSRSVFSDSSRRDEPTLWVPVVSSYGQAYLPEEEATRLVPDIDAQPYAPLPRKPEGRAHSEPASTSASGPAPETGEKPAIATEAPVGPTASPVTEHKSSSQQDDVPDVLPDVDSQAAGTNEEMPWLPSGPEVAGTRQAQPPAANLVSVQKYSNINGPTSYPLSESSHSKNPYNYPFAVTSAPGISAPTIAAPQTPAPSLTAPALTAPALTAPTSAPTGGPTFTSVSVGESAAGAAPAQNENIADRVPFVGFDKPTGAYAHCLYKTDLNQVPRSLTRTI